jgi:hypothetical protein
MGNSKGNSGFQPFMLGASAGKNRHTAFALSNIQKYIFGSNASG